MAAGRHPVHGSMTTIGKIVHLNGHLDSTELRRLKDRLESLSHRRDISRTYVKAHRGDHTFLSVVDDAVGSNAARGSIAKEKLCAMQLRIRERELAARASQCAPPDSSGT